MFNELLNETEYKYDSGGVPSEITKLSYEEFLDFHKWFYHPSNCSFISYGNLDIENHLRILDEEFLSQFEKS